MENKEIIKWVDDKVEEIVEKVYQSNDAFCVICGAESYPVDDEFNRLGIDEPSDNAMQWHIDHDEDCLISKLDDYRVMRLDERNDW